jgi:HEAT repeat protein
MLKYGALAAALALLPAGTTKASPRATPDRPLEHWVKRLDSKDRDTRREAVQKIAALGPQGRAAGPALAARLGDADVGLVFDIAQALIAVGAPEAEAGTRELLVRRRPRCGGNYLEDGHLHQFPGPVVAHLASIVQKDRHPGTRVLAAEVLGRLRAHSSVGPKPRSLFSRAGASADLVVPALTAALKDAVPAVRVASASALVALDPRQSKTVVPVAVALIADGAIAPDMPPHVMRHAEDDAVALLARLLDSDDSGRRERAGRGLACLAPASLPALTRALRSGPARSRLAAAQGLASANGNLLRPVVPALTAALADEEKQVRYEAALTLARVDPKKARPALPALVAALREGAAPYGPLAGQALVQLGPEARPAVPALLRALKDERPGSRFQAAWALAAIDPGSAAPVVPVLAEALAEKSGADRRAAAVAAGRIGPAARATVPALRACLTDRTPHLRLAAANALVKIDRAEAKTVVPVLVALMRDRGLGKGMVRRECIEALTRIGPDAAAARPALLEVLADKDSAFQMEAAGALVRIDSGRSGPGMKALRAELAGPNGEWRDEALDVLEKLGPLGSEAVPELTGLLRSRHPHVAERAAEVLGKIGPGASAAAPELRALLRHRHSDVRKAAAEALRQVAP